MKNLFVWLPQGRLGNLIFQYQAMSSIASGGWTFAIDSEFFDLFEKPRRITVLPVRARLRRRALLLWVSFFENLAQRRVIGLIEPELHCIFETFTGESLALKRRVGFLKNVFLVKGFFQTPRYMDPLPCLKPDALVKAESRLSKISKSDRVAVHMRFGDYVEWSVFGVRGLACLPDSYYLNAVRLIRARVPTAHLILVSDEPSKARAILESVYEHDRIEVIEDGTAQSDFATIACCSHAVIAASSFSWWAATLISNPSRQLIAPEFWAGFRKRAWYPPNIESGHFIYVDPLAQDPSSAAESVDEEKLVENNAVPIN